MRVAWVRSALREVAHIHDYLSDFNPEAARRVAQALVDAADSLSSLPYRGRPVDGGMRELLTVYPYIIRYELLPDLVRILRVRHGMQR